MSEDGLDPVIHAPARLRIAVTLAALHDGDNLSFTTLQDLIGLTPGNLITHLRKLEDAGYVTTAKNGSGVTATAGGLVFHGEPDGNLQAYDARTGDLIWQFQTGFYESGPVAVYQAGGQQYVAALAAGALWGLSRANDGD